MKISKELIEIEELEYDYFNKIHWEMAQDIQKMIDGLNSKDKIIDDWINAFKGIDKKRQTSDFARGAERIYYWLFNQFGKPNSAPIGADMFFEHYNAFVHIDIKTAKVDNPSDYKGKIPIGENQTSYASPKKGFNVNLPAYYNEGKKEQKICLTYAIGIIFKPEDKYLKILSILLVSIPNKKLYPIYKDRIIGCGKSKGKSFRYEYKNSPYFVTLPEKPYRVKFLFRNHGITEEQILGFKIK
ncbi:MAG: hypothetical protein AUJ85_00250 [Elusimicrobia bacterium CG1_02_37_114]|nr:MAG: hypothetical protein AUJ85_00250 [Elusimicrobia bacterium CG1_02_37_114]PIV53131.1 MAG: hypothetical protein COS17_05365 [Elusimicrobia bacterium CG02_land_8_20_14_3_00_37_13]PIZ13878.1 MAG: hypothetical protein COY53_02360 [Elusimicrobia bacterium CG_4_10_14_0_8_um_filter_37_32]